MIFTIGSNLILIFFISNPRSEQTINSAINVEDFDKKQSIVGVLKPRYVELGYKSAAACAEENRFKLDFSTQMKLRVLEIGVTIVNAPTVLGMAIFEVGFRLGNYSGVLSQCKEVVCYRN